MSLYLLQFEKTVRILRKHDNPELTAIRAILTNCHTRRIITGRVSVEVQTLYPVLGSVRMDAKLLDATSCGSMLRLNRSRALDDYEVVLNSLNQRCNGFQTH